MLDIEKKKVILLMCNTFKKQVKILNELGLDESAMDMQAVIRNLIGAMVNLETNELYNKIMGE